MTGQTGCEALEAINEKIGELADLVRAIKAQAREYAEEVQETDDELAVALAEGRQADLPRIIRRRLIPVAALGQLGDCLRHSADELGKYEQVERNRLSEVVAAVLAGYERRAAA